MKNTNRNIRIIVAPHAPNGSFDVYLDFSGKKEYLVTHRYNPALYAALKDGASLETLQREKAWKPRSGVRNSRRVRQAERTARHLNAVIEDYLQYREDYLWRPDAA